tara:strand:- start:148 stop:366 length:219 start_codon:yes stop_codon:yes gene_type:complete
VNHYLLFVYGVCFALIGGAAFAMMWANIRSITTMNDPIKSKRHPEAPAAGEEVMYVDLSRERLEDLYKQDKD